MKLKDTFLIGAVAVAGLTSCVSESLDAEGKDAGTGSMALNVSLKEPAATRAITEVTNFPVILYNADGATVHSWNTVSEVPATYTLSVGNYTVESHTPGTIQKRMSTPYYKGTADLEIQKDVTTDVDVVCKMQNASITVRYDADFLSVFSTWNITLDDGSDSNIALSFSNTDGTTPDVVYWLFEENVSQLTLNFRGTTKEGSTVSARNVLTKAQATERYDDDNEYFGGGDAIVINFTPVESTSGHVTGITINATVTFDETEETVSLNVTDNGTLEPGGDTPGGDTPGPGPGPSDEVINLNLPDPISYPFLGAASVDKNIGDTEIKAEKGLKSIIVSIESTSQEMVSSVGDLNTNYGVDFIGGAEIVGNQDVVTLFNDLNQPLSVPAEGDTEYTFPIGNFFELLQVLVGEHTFHLTVTDMEGNTKTGTVVITITM